MLYSGFHVYISPTANPCNPSSGFTLEVMDSDPENVRQLKLQTLEDFKTGLDYYFARDFAAARGQFYKVLALNPDDQTVTLYLKRVMQFIETGVPKDWDGVAVFDQK